MSGFTGGAAMGGIVSDLIRQVQSQGNAQTGQTPATTPPAAPQGVGPGEPTQGSPYGGQGTYNTLTQDMSRGFMGNYGFGNNMFGYQPYGNPYFQPQMPPQQQQPYQPPWTMGGYGGYGGNPYDYRATRSGYGGSSYGSYKPMSPWGMMY